VANINTAGVIGEYNNKDRTANLNNKAPYIRLKAIFGEYIYIKGGLFLFGREGFIRRA
jgi:hypothetical protein